MTVLYRKKPDDSYPAFLRNSSAMMYSARRFLPFLCIIDLACLQREILSVVQRYVKPGGTLVYSTCTVNREENEDNMRWFLEHFPFEPVNLKGRLGEKLSEPSMESGYIQFLPGIHPCDGFFIAVMKKCG